MLPRKFKCIFKRRKKKKVVNFSIYFLEKENSDSNVNFGQVILVLLFYIFLDAVHHILLA